MKLKQKTINGIKWTTLSTVVTTTLQFLQLVILARFLEPSEFGLMTLVSLTIGFSKVFLDVGISNAIIHKQDITDIQLSTLYWINIIAGIILFFLLLLIAPFIALFYNEPNLTSLILLLSITFLIQPFGQQFMMLWQKEMRFDEIAYINILTKFVTLSVSVIYAYYGYGVYSLVLGALAGTITQTFQLMYKGLKEYKPLFVFEISNVKEFLSFGFYQMGENVINYFNSQMDVILIGKLLGTEALGIYYIAKQIIMKPLQIINPIILKVAFPLMAKLQDKDKELKKIYLQIINYIASINFPIYIFFIIFAKEIVLFIFGEKWLVSVPIIEILSIYGAFRSLGNPIGSLLLAKGKANWGFWWNFGLLFYIPIVIIITSKWGLLGISWGLVFVIISLIVPNWYFLVKNLCFAKFIEYHKNIFIPFLITIFSGLVVYFVIGFVDTIFIKFIVSIFLGTSLLIILHYIFNKQFLFSIREFIS